MFDLMVVGSESLACGVPPDFCVVHEQHLIFLSEKPTGKYRKVGE